MGKPTMRGVDPLTLYRVEGEHWLWTGYRDKKGYGHFGSHLAHRLFYERHVGPIPDGLELDHKCRTPQCVRPGHLEPVTHELNVQRSTAGEVNAARQRAKEACVRGHAFTPENTRIDRRGHRACRECSRLLHRGYYHENVDANRAKARERMRERRAS